jgi:transposase
MTNHKAANNRIDSLDLDLIMTRRNQGRFIREIAKELGIAISTVSNAIKRYHELNAPASDDNDTRVCYKTESVGVGQL